MMNRRTVVHVALPLCAALAVACAHGGEVTPTRASLDDVKRAVNTCDVEFFSSYMTPQARETFLEVTRLGSAMLGGVEALKDRVGTRYGVEPVVEADGTVVFPEAVSVGDDRADARINLGFSITHECTVLAQYGEEVLLRDPEVSGPCREFSQPHSNIRIVRTETGCSIDLTTGPEEARVALDLLTLFVTFLDEQNRVLEMDQALSYVDWGGQFMGSFKATMAAVQSRVNPEPPSDP